MQIVADVSAFPDSLTPFVLDPPAINLDQMRPEIQKKPWEYEIKIKNVSEQELRPKLIYPLPGEFVKVDFPDDEIKPGKDKTIKFKFYESIADTLFKKSMTFEVNDSAQTRYTIPIEKARRWGPTTASK